MRNEKDREELSRYFGSHPKSNSSKKGGDDFFGDQTMQFFDNTQDEDDEDMKVVSDGFDDFAGYDESDANRRPKKRRGQSKLSRFAQSFVFKSRFPYRVSLEKQGDDINMGGVCPLSYNYIPLSSVQETGAHKKNNVQRRGYASEASERVDGMLSRRYVCKSLRSDGDNLQLHIPYY